jgi:hypothetical protein
MFLTFTLVVKGGYAEVTDDSVFRTSQRSLIMIVAAFGDIELLR